MSVTKARMAVLEFLKCPETGYLPEGAIPKVDALIAAVQQECAGVCDRLSRRTPYWGEYVLVIVYQEGKQDGCIDCAKAVRDIKFLEK